jgi:glycosyltransferase involved in cell wall biosynthesis
MRLAFVIYGDLAKISGGFIYDRRLVGALVGLGHEVDVIGLPWVGYARALAGNLPAWMSFQSSRQSSRHRAKDGPLYDAVIQDELIHPSVFRQDRRLILGGPRASEAVVALVHNLRSQQPRERFVALKGRVERRYLRTVDGVIAVCRRTLSDVAALAGTGRPSMVAYPGRDHVAPEVDRVFVHARSLEPGPLRVLHVASVVPAKGLHRLVRSMAIALAADPAVTLSLDVVGACTQPGYLGAIRRQISELGLDSQVRLHGQLEGAALHDIFRRSHVLALPSDREAYSLACLEGLGFGLPVIATGVGGLSEMITHGQEGFLLDPGDPVDPVDPVDLVDLGAATNWADKLRFLAKDRGALRRMGCAAVARYDGHATWRQVAITIQDFLRERVLSLRREDVR